MQKLIIVALLASCAFAAQIGIGATCTVGTNGFDDNGVCRFCYPTCKTCKGPAKTDCLTCNAVTDANKDTNCAPLAGADATNGGECKCAAGKFLTTKTTDGSQYDFQCCDAKGDLPTLTACPIGFGQVRFGTTAQRGCAVCGDAQANCKDCDNVGADDQTGAATACSNCFNGAVNAGACTISTAAYIRYQGEVAACIDGYFPDGTTKQCTALGKWCKTGTSATACTECIAKHGLKADNSCEACVNGKVGTDKKCLILGCTENDATDATKCKAEKCDTAAGFAKNTEAAVCACESHKWKKTTAATATEAEKIECAACTKECAAGDTCSDDGATCTKKAVTVACDDATLKDSGCITCAKATEGDMKDKYVCSACREGTKLGTAGSKACVCSGGTDVEAWNKATNACVKCDAKCTETGKTSCNLGTDSKATCGAAPAATGTDATGTDAASNGILISAISMIIAVILA